MPEGDWKLKFRRILLVHQSTQPHEWLELLRLYANDVTLVSLDNYFARDYLEMPADCLILDSRVQDLMGAEMTIHHARMRSLPYMAFVDGRFSAEAIQVLQVHMPSASHVVRYSPNKAHAQIASFLEETPAFDYEALYRRSPWVMNPWTVTLSQIAAAEDVRYASFLFGADLGGSHA